MREIRKRAIILVAADKGLCGALNTNVFRLAAKYDPESTVFIAAGRRAAQFLARTRRQMVAEFAYSDAPRFPDAKAIAVFASDLFLKGEVDQVLLIATKFINTLMQEPRCLEYLPVGEIKGMKIPEWNPKPNWQPIPARCCSNPALRPSLACFSLFTSISTCIRSC